MFVLEFTTVFAAGVGATTLGTIDSQVSLLGYVLASLFCAG
ncbi:MAG: hypothetical protein K0Q76_3469, partial [Panacagrimonas sp.]|nr:hypothetical protein [Panacagrimonas sp.]